MKKKLKQIRCNLPIDVVESIEAYKAEQDIPFSIAIEQIIKSYLGADSDAKTKKQQERN